MLKGLIQRRYGLRPGTVMFVLILLMFVLILQLFVFILQLFVLILQLFRYLLLLHIFLIRLDVLHTHFPFSSNEKRRLIKVDNRRREGVLPIRK
jgi:hypothetical protein